MKKIFKTMLFGCLVFTSLVGCDTTEETNSNSNTQNNSTEKSNVDTPVEAKLTGITLDTASVKKAYTYGEALDLTGLVVTANYDDNSNKSVTSYTTDPANGTKLNSVGDVAVTVNYEGKTSSFNVTVNKVLTGIAIDTTNVKKDYNYGDALDLTGLVVTANYNNNTSEAVTEYTTSPADGYTLSTVGDVPVTVTYEGKTTSFNVRVDKVLTGITLNTDNVKKSYAHNETLDLTGLVVTANYNDNSSEVVTDYDVNPGKNAVLDTVGNKTITVTYGGKTNSFDVVVNKTLKSISINTDNVKKEYKHNETFDTTGLVVTATYSDNSTEVVTNYTTNPLNGAVLDTVGSKTIAVTYGEKTKTFDINVVAVLERISVDTTNVKVSYNHKETLDLTGLVVIAYYSDGSNQNVTDYTTNPANGAVLNTVGNNTVNVSYQGKSTSFGVNVAKTITKITLETSNVKTTYRHGESVDLTGLIVLANYSDGTMANVSDYATNDVPVGYTFTVFNNLTITISYGGKSASFTCNCPPFSEEGTTAYLDLNRELTFGGNGWAANTTMISGYGTPGSTFMPHFQLTKNSTAEGSMTLVNGKTRFLAGDKIETSDAISGITKITVHGGNGYFTLAAGYSKDKMYTFLEATSDGGDRIYEDIPNVNYFSITGTHDNFPADISMIEIEYTRNAEHASVSGKAKTIDEVTVVEGTFIKGDKTIVVSGSDLTINGDEYNFVGIEYKDSILYQDHSGNTLLVKFVNNNEIEVTYVKDRYSSISGTYSKSIPATSITLSKDLNTVAENSPSTRFNMTSRDFFAFSASCNAVPTETPTIKLVDETNGTADPVVGTYTLRDTISVTDALYTVEDFELSINPIVVTKVGDTYKVSYVDVGNDDYTSHSGNYDAEFKNNKLTISADDGFEVTIDLDARKVEFQYYNEDDYVYLMGDMAYNFVSSSKPTATLDNGLVRAVSAGDFYLEALTSNGIAARYYVHVSEYVPAMITVDTTPVALNIGDTHNINPSITANATKPGVSYESSNGDVATVSNTGLVTAVAPGTTTITIATNDDTKTIEVTVNGGSQPVGVTYTFEDENSDEHTLVVNENVSITLDGLYTFNYDSSLEKYVYTENNSVVIYIRKSGATFLEMEDPDSIIFGYYDNPVYLTDIGNGVQIYEA